MGERWEATLNKARTEGQLLEGMEECPECGCWLDSLIDGNKVVAVLNTFEQAVLELREWALKQRNEGAKDIIEKFKRAGADGEITFQVKGEDHGQKQEEGD